MIDIKDLEPMLSKTRQAVARGWCSPKNEKKIMDVDLAEAISIEIVKMLLQIEFHTG